MAARRYLARDTAEIELHVSDKLGQPMALSGVTMTALRPGGSQVAILPVDGGDGSWTGTLVLDVEGEWPVIAQWTGPKQGARTITLVVEPLPFLPGQLTSALLLEGGGGRLLLEGGAGVILLEA